MTVCALISPLHGQSSMPDLQNDSSSSTTGFLAQLPPRPMSTDDMDDRAEIAYYREAVAAGQVSWKPVLEALELSHRVVYPSFQDEDQLALHYQSGYQRLSLAAVGLGAVTVILAISQLAANLHFVGQKPTPDFVIRIVKRIVEGLGVSEAIFAAATLIVIFYAFIIRPKEKWLAARFKAEALRVYKFNMLCDERLWSGHRRDREVVETEVRSEVAELRRKTFRDAEDWSVQGTVPSLCRAPASEKCPDAQNEFIRYYRAKRLEAQMLYLERKARSREEQGAKWRVWMQFLFWGSLAFVLGHLALTLGADSEHENEFVSNSLIALAAWLPAIAGAVRTYKSSREFERNALRHEATLFILEKLAARLDASQSCGENYVTIGFCEQVLEADSREWMRLMVSAEWYG